MPDDNEGLESGGTAATAYADAVSVYLAFAISKVANYRLLVCLMDERPRLHFAKRLRDKRSPWLWDFAEATPSLMPVEVSATALIKARCHRNAFPALAGTPTYSG